MIRLMIVDDEPYIREGLKVLIDWEEQGCKIVAEAGNAQEALAILENTTVDLIIADIRMPQIDGLKLIEIVKEKISNKIKFVILSGFSDFEYAKRAIAQNVFDYILKPVQKDELINMLKRVKEELLREQVDEQSIITMKNNQIKNSIDGLIGGLYNNASLGLIKDNWGSIERLRYILIRFEGKKTIEQSDIELVKKRIGEHVLQFIEHNNANNTSISKYHITSEKHITQTNVEFGLVLINGEGGCSDTTLIESLYSRCMAMSEYVFDINVGSQVKILEELADSYKSAIKANMSQFMVNQKHGIHYYDETKARESTRHTVSYEKIERLTKCVKEHNQDKIQPAIEAIYDELKDGLVEPELIQMNISYILYYLVDLSKDLLGTLEQEEIMQYLSDKMIAEISYKGDVQSFMQTVLEFSDYLYQLKNSSSSVVLNKVIKEVDERYGENLSLKELGKKYFINNVYLGQIFKKEKGMSFKDYLNTVRIEKAAEILLHSNERIYTIAEMVGYQNPDYFISKFVTIKGTTPHQFRLKGKK